MTQVQVHRPRPKTPLLVAEIAIFAALIVVGLVRGTIPPWWALLAGTVGFGVAIAYTLGHRPFGRYTLAVLVAWVLILSLTSCSGPVYTTAPGPGIPPTIVGAHFTHDGEDMECGIGLTRDGVGAIVTIFAPPAGFVAWLAWTVTDGEPVTKDLKACWDTSQANWHEFELMTQCWGQPVVTSTWTDMGAASQWVKMPFCQCNATCQHEAWMIAAAWAQVQDWCRSSYGWFFCWGLGPSMAMTETTLPADQSLDDAGFAPAAYDTSIPQPAYIGGVN